MTGFASIKGQAGTVPAGMCVSTRGVIESGVNIFPLLARHFAGDWGDLEADDKAANEEAIIMEERILSAYETPAGLIYIITEADRSATTVLLADEY